MKKKTTWTLVVLALLAAMLWSSTTPALAQDFWSGLIDVAQKTGAELRFEQLPTSGALGQCRWVMRFPPSALEAVKAGLSNVGPDYGVPYIAYKTDGMMEIDEVRYGTCPGGPQPPALPAVDPAAQPANNDSNAPSAAEISGAAARGVEAGATNPIQIPVWGYVIILTLVVIVLGFLFRPG